MDLSGLTVDHFSADSTSGAAVAALRLHRSLLALGAISRYWHAPVSRKSLDEPGCRLVRWTDYSAGFWEQVRARLLASARKVRMARKKQYWIKGRPEGLESFSAAEQPHPTPLPQASRHASVVHLHSVATMIDYRSFFGSLPDRVPVVWTLYDMNPMSGGCHYVNGCEAYRTTCQHCPQLGRPSSDDLSRQTFQIKMDALRGKNIHIVAPSHGAEQVARASAVLSDVRTIQTIHHGVDVAQFVPMDKSVAKRRLGIPEDRVVVAFGAESIDKRRKGFRELMVALSRVADHGPITGLVFGNGRGSEIPPHLDLKKMGYVSDRQQQATIYSAADMFILPSLEEVFGLTALEAMACGTPVVAFRTEGISDYIRPGTTGFLAESGDCAGLAWHIVRLVENRQMRHRMGEHAREMVEREFSAELQTARYVELYGELVRSMSNAVLSGRAA